MSTQSVGNLKTASPTAKTLASLDQIPTPLRNSNRWIVWKKEKRNGKFTKVPYDAKEPEKCLFAKTNDPATWASFEVARDAADLFGDYDFDGIGFMLHGSKFVGIDFDGVVDDGVPEPYVLNIISQLGGPYCEITPSGTGLRVFIECPALPAGNRKFNAKKKGVEKYAAEIYTGSEGGRYLTCTGDRYSGTGIPVVANLDLVYFLISKFADEHFRRLWMGDISAYENDDSKADFALLKELAKATKNDAAKMEKFFGASVLGKREKWIGRKDYPQRSIKAAIESNPTNKPAPDELIFSLPAVVTTEANDGDYVLARIPDQSDPEDDGWFPRGAVSLVGAPSAAGKTTTMYQLLLTQACKGFFLGHASYGLPFCVMGVDRGEAAHRRTMRRMRLNPGTLPFEGLKLCHDAKAVQQIVEKIEGYAAKTGALPAIVLVEGVDILLTKVNDILCVSNFMNLLNQVATRYHIAIIGTLGAPKIKVGQGYTCLRDNVLGSGGWSRECEAMIIIQVPQGPPAVTKGKRVMTVLLRNGRDEQYTLGFNHGQLEQVPDIVEDGSSKHTSATEIDWFQTQALLAKSDPTKRYWTVLDVHEALEISESTAARHVSHALAKGYIKIKPGKKVGKGAAAQYQWNESETNPIWTAQQTQDVDEQQAF